MKKIFLILILFFGSISISNAEGNRIIEGNKDAKIVWFCRRGYYAKIAAERLGRMGYTKVFLYPGTDLWEDTGNRLVIVKPEVMGSKK